MKINPRSSIKEEIELALNKDNLSFKRDNNLEKRILILAINKIGNNDDKEKKRK